MGNKQQRIFANIRLAAAFILAMFGAITIPSAQAQTFSVLYNFGGASDGGDPYATLLRDAAGTLYSTVDYGGTSFAGGVFKVAADGTETMLYSFTGGADGAYPFSPVVRDSAGNLYGTTSQGGSANAGVVFKVDPSGTETVLHNFTGGADGVIPIGGLVRDKAGNLYGTTSQGGTSNDGIVFKINPRGKETILHTFTGSATDGTRSPAIERSSADPGVTVAVSGTTPAFRIRSRTARAWAGSWRVITVPAAPARAVRPDRCR